MKKQVTNTVMRPMYVTKGKAVECFTDHGLRKSKPLFDVALNLVKQGWAKNGKPHRGLCATGKGIEVRYASPGRRVGEMKVVVDFDFEQQEGICEYANDAVRHLENNGIESRIAYGRVN